MGYSTDFIGKLKILGSITPEMLAFLNTICGEDCRDHPEWHATNLTYMDLSITKDFQYIIWDGSEKSYDMVDKVNLLIKLVREKFTDFGLEGEFMAYGEQVGDIWALAIENGKAVHKKVKLEIER